MQQEPRLFLMFEFEESRTEFSDEAYAAIGRALTFATRFESNCRALAAIDALRDLASASRQQSESQDFDTIVSRVAEEYWESRRLRHHAQSITFRYQFPPQIRKVVQAARKARNVLAHEFTLGVIHGFEDDSGRAKILASLAELTSEIAEGDRIVALIIHVENGDPPLTSTHFDSYVRRAVAWVCDVTAQPAVRADRQPLG